MPLHVNERRDRPGTFQITGKIEGYNFIRKTAQSRERKLAEEEAAVLEARLLRERFHGRRSDCDRPFAEIAEAYLEFEPRHPANRKRVLACVVALGDVLASEAAQDATIDRLRKTMLRPNPMPATVRATIITPIRAVLNFGASCNPKMCAPPNFKLPKIKKSKTEFFLPLEAARLISMAAPHLEPLLLFLFGTGARLGEALALDWQQVDLTAGRATLLRSRPSSDRTKTDSERFADLPPAVVAALAQLPHRTGTVFQWETKQPKDDGSGQLKQGKRRSVYAEREGGGQIKTGWNNALMRAGINRHLTPHATRHSWASWHYALFNDIVRLRDDGNWKTIAMVERYQKRLPAGHEHAICQLWGLPATVADAALARNLARSTYRTTPAVNGGNEIGHLIRQASS